jgi:hypothetical protein
MAALTVGMKIAHSAHERLLRLTHVEQVWPGTDRERKSTK